MNKGQEESDASKINVRVESSDEKDDLQPADAKNAEVNDLDEVVKPEADSANFDEAQEPEQSPSESTFDSSGSESTETSDPEEPIIMDEGTTADDEKTQPIVAPVLPIEPSKKRPKKLIMGSALVVVGVACIGVWALMSGKQAEIANTSEIDTPQKVTLMGADVALIDGTAQVSSDATNWSSLTAGDTAKQGMYYRTSDDSRLVINLDDGSAIRLNSNSTVRLESLDVSNVVVTNVEGETYARLVKSDRTFSIKADDETYTALGTAYSTLNTDETKGVEVYESSVKLINADVDVSEGKYYYTDAKDEKDEGKVGSISKLKLQNDEFIKWNYTQDKKNKEFKDSLGYLVSFDEKTEDQPKPEDKEDETGPSNGINLSGSKYDTGVKLSWSVSGIAAPKGFKILKSSYANPVFGKDGTSATYLSDSSARSFAWTIKDGGTYNFRVCTYTGDGCNNYSNNITVTAPKVSGGESAGPSGSVSLQQKYDNKVKWTLNGSAPDGYKLVWSEDPNPKYPGSDAKYYGKDSTVGEISESSGTYYVRVCLYKHGYGCKIYSNQITLTL